MVLSGIFIVYLSIRIFALWEPESCLPCSSLYSQWLELCLAQKRCSTGIFWINKQAARRGKGGDQRERNNVLLENPILVCSNWFLSSSQGFWRNWLISPWGPLLCLCKGVGATTLTGFYSSLIQFYCILQKFCFNSLWAPFPVLQLCYRGLSF